MDLFRHHWRNTPRPARQFIVLVVGVVLIVSGGVMLVLPGPGWATIFLGLAILATEFDQAKEIKNGLVKRFKRTVRAMRKTDKR